MADTKDMLMNEIEVRPYVTNAGSRRATRNDDR